MDTTYDIGNLFDEITANIRKNNSQAECVLDGIITISTEKPDEPVVKNAIAKTAGNFIVNNIEQDKIREMVKGYNITAYDERKIVTEFKQNYSNNNSRCEIIENEIKNHLETSNKLYLDGMVDFRLFDYKKTLDILLENTVDNYMTQKAYDEFLDLLKYFVDMQEVNDLCVYVSGNSCDGYILRDENKIEIKLTSDEEFFSEMSICNLKHDDVLISRLISISPSKIIMQTSGNNNNIIKTLQKIFENKISFEFM